MPRALSLARLELLKNLCVGHSSSLRLRGTGLEASRAGAAVSLALPWLRIWRQWRRAEVTGAGGTGRKLVFWWRSCSQVRHAGGTCGAVGSEGGTPLSRDGALLYSRSPEGVVIGVSWFRSKVVIVSIKRRNGNYKTYGA